MTPQVLSTAVRGPVLGGLRATPGVREGSATRVLFWVGLAGLAVLLPPLGLHAARLLALEIMVALFHFAGWPWP